MNRFVLAPDVRRRVPITIVGGPEGAGKTTLLRHLLTHNDGRRVAVVLEDPAALELSKLSVTALDGNSLLLANGSICLGLDGDVGTALSQLHKDRTSRLPDHVVLEAPASATPQRLLGYGYLPGFRTGGMIVVVSATDLCRARGVSTDNTELVETQVRLAEIVVLNKLDDIDPAARRVVRRWVEQRATRARIIESSRCCIPASMLLGADVDHVPVHAIRGQWTPAYSVESEPRRYRVTQPRHEGDYRAWLLTTRNGVDARAFREWVTTLPDSIVRGDGILRVSDGGGPSHWSRFRRCGLQWSLSADSAAAASDTQPSWIALVGLASSAARAGGSHGEDVRTDETRSARSVRSRSARAGSRHPIGALMR